MTGEIAPSEPSERLTIWVVELSAHLPSKPCRRIVP
jgi:hypothetical protein